MTLAALQHRAVAAAEAVAAAGGLTVTDAAVIHSGSNVLVHLRPGPVVARVMTGTVALHDDPQRWLTREIAVLAFLAPTGLAVSPSRLIAPGPHCHDGLWMTFTEWVADVVPAPEALTGASADGAHALGRRLRALHDALRGFDGELGGLSDLRADIERLLGHLRPADDESARAVASLRQRLDALGPGVFESPLPVQALHGDVSLRNQLRTPHAVVWNDFEDTFRGPVHWDVASYVGSLRVHGADDRLVRRMLAGYGWDDERELAPFLAAQDVYDEIWKMFDRQRRAPVADRTSPAMGQRDVTASGKKRN